MSLFQVLGLLTTVIALFGYINHRFVRLPDTLGITAVGFVVSLVLVVAGHHQPALVHWAQSIIESIDFYEVVFHVMLPLLLFAGALHVDISQMAKEKVSILALATVGVALSTFVVGYLLHYALAWCGVNVALVYCLLFGALISPTDPIAVLGVLKKVGVSKGLETKISGESLFNDGTAVVAFVLLLGIATQGTTPTVAGASLMLAKEVLGAGVLGIAAGYLGVLMIRDVENYPLEILITLALALGGYGLAEIAHVSAPLAVVVAGLVMGNVGAKRAMSASTRTHLFGFWELVDELLTLVLFGLIGIEMLALDLTWLHMGTGLIAVMVVLFARWISVSVPLTVLEPFRNGTGTPHAVKILTWGGLRGGISIALALSLPNFEGRDLVIGATYIVVLFSLLVQATTLSPLLRYLNGKSAD